MRIAALAIALSLTPLAANVAASDFQGKVLNAAAVDDRGQQRFIIKFKEGSSARGSDNAARSHLGTLARNAGVKMVHDKRLAIGADVIEVSERLDRVAATRLMEQLARDPSVEYIEPDAVMTALLTPNDTRYGEQWHYSSNSAGIRAPAAWDVTNGAGIRVAVIDTGIVAHSDMDANIVGGYDFISSSATARDGNGRDADPRDEGDWVSANECGYSHPASGSSWHGLHVAGTVAAVTNNNKGVAGVAYGAKVVPIRVLGKCGGTLSDIADAIVWAAGGSVGGVPANAHPAEVINMSLGGSGSCGATYQAAIDAAVANGTTVVVAAGNENVNVSNSRPANCNNVIAVAATTSAGARASFSNYGTLVDVAAPGQGILSTLNASSTTPGTESYASYNGTSMAAPHVAGVVALMQSVAVNTPASVETILKNTSYPLPGACSGGCGSGIVDAAAAVAAASGGGSPNPDPGGTLTRGVAVTGLGAASGNALNFTMSVPAGASNLSFATSGGSGDADLYVRFGSAPTDASYDCRPYQSGNNETCSFATPQAGVWHVRVKAYSTFSGLSLVGNYTTAPSNVPPVANFSFTVNNLSVNFSDTSSDSDGSIASRSWNFGDGSSSSAANPSKTYASAGSYTVGLTVTDNAGASHSVSKTVTVTAPPSGGGTLTKGVAVNGLSASSGNALNYTLAVPAGASNLVISTSGGSGDADLYVKFGSAPTDSSYDCRPYRSGNNETCTIAAPQAGTYHVRVKAYTSFSGLSLVGDYTQASSQPSFFENTTDYTINNLATVSSPITVSGRSGNAPSALKVNVRIIHTYIGDLRVRLLGPSGAVVATLHNRTGGSTDNIIGSYTVNASGQAANGTWRLEVYDAANGDTGYIDSWSLQF